MRRSELMVRVMDNWLASSVGLRVSLMTSGKCQFADLGRAGDDEVCVPSHNMVDVPVTCSMARLNCVQSYSPNLQMNLQNL